MKKLRIIMPTILVAPILFGCNQNKTCSFIFSSDYCSLDNEDKYTANKSKEITLTMTLNNGYEYCEMPNDVVVLIGKKEAKKGTDYTYIINENSNNKSATIKLAITDNTVISARLSDSDSAFRINPNKWEDAITFKNIEYIQMARIYAYSSVFLTETYDECYVSPNVCDIYLRNLTSTTVISDEYYVEKTEEEGEDKYYRYNQDDTTKEWTKESSTAQEFITPKIIGEQIKRILEKGNVTYEIIKDKYDKYRQAYYFDVTNQEGYPYSVILSFYDNRLNYFSYSYYDTTSSRIEWGATNFTFGILTPELPEVPEL